jgi:ABC-2 type transport system permease protein
MNKIFKNIQSARNQSLLQLLLIAGILIFINIVGRYLHKHLDLTEENRFTLTDPTKKLLADIKEPVTIRVLLEGEFPAGFKRLQNGVIEMLNDMRAENGNIQYSFEDPNQGSTAEINRRREELAKDGIMPMSLNVKGAGETKRMVIYPHAIVTYGGRSVPVSLMENQIPNQPEVTLNNSVSTLEYKFSSAIQKAMFDSHPKVVFTTGHGELSEMQTADLERSLSQFYQTKHMLLDSFSSIKKDVSVLVVAKPTKAFSDKDKFKIDQFVMNGGKVLWLIDRMNGELDSMNRTGRQVPADYPTNLEDILFKYGARIQPNMVLDLESTFIPLRTGAQGSEQQFENFKWFYHPMVSSKSNHPIVKNLDRVNLFYPSRVDTIRTKTPIKKTVLLESSDYSREQFSPVEVNFEILKYEIDKSKFDKKRIPMALLLEGVFPSLYENRVSPQMLQGLDSLGQKFVEKSAPTKMLVVADGDIAANSFDNKNGVPFPTGYNRFMGYAFANKDFLLNAIEYMLDEKQLIEARSKEIKLRMLDEKRLKEEKIFWQFINIVLPLIILGIFAAFYTWWRKRKYAKPFNK